jgi:transcriptional regulator with PAS, ATPase and Fis domain
MKELVETAKELGTVDATVLIEGETGTGKEVIARIIHESGQRASKPFVALNCAAFPEHLLESELFGHRQGAFTGADRNRKGILESAEDGTVLLDEIDKASGDFQAKLLRVIEERQLRPVGSSKWLPLHARILCATNRDLRLLADKRTFLPDLFYRLSGFRLQLPPLRKRPEDIPALVEHFLDRCVGRFRDAAYQLSPGAATALSTYHWPGNVRELRNVVESGAFYARTDGVIEAQHLPPEIQEGSIENPGSDTLPARIAGFERRQIIAAMKQARGVKTEAARILGVSRKGLNDRLRRLGLE